MGPTALWGALSLLLLLLLLTGLPTLASASCLTSDDCAGFPCSLPPSTSTLPGTCACPANRYELDGSLSLTSPSPTCASTLSTLHPTLFLATRVLLLTLFSLLLLASLTHLHRLQLTRALRLGAPLLSLLLTLALTLLTLLYLALDPLTTLALLSPLPSSLLLLLPDPLLLLSYLSLFPYLRDLLLLSPLITDVEYNQLVHSGAVVRGWAGVGVGVLALLPLSLGWGGVGVGYFAAWVGLAGGYSGYLLWRLYGLAGRDRRAVRRVSIIVAPLSQSLQTAPPAGEHSWMVAETGASRIGESVSVPLSSSAPTLSPRPSNSPQSSASAGQQPSVASAADLRPSAHALPAGQSGAKGGGRRVSLVVSGGVGQKPVKAYAMSRVNVRRLIRVHISLALGFIGLYLYLLASAAVQPQSDVLFFAPRMPARTVVVLYLVKGLWTWLWGCAMLATTWPSTKATRGRVGHRGSLSITKAAAGTGRGSTLHSPVVKQTPNQQTRHLTADRTADATAAGPAAAVEAEEAEGEEDIDEDEVAEQSREMAIAMMDASTAVAQLQAGGPRNSLALVVSQSPTAAPYDRRPSATSLSNPPAVSLGPTSLLEPASVFPFPPPAFPLTSLPHARSMPAVRHSLPAIHVDPMLLSHVMRTLTEPNTPKEDSLPSAPAGLLSPPPRPLLAGDLASVERVRRGSEGAGLMHSSRARTGSISSAGSGGGGLGPLGRLVGERTLHERQGSRTSSILRDVISPRNTSSKGSRHQRIFTPAAAALEG